MWFPLNNVEVGIYFFFLLYLNYYSTLSLIQILITEVPEFYVLKIQ